MALMMHGMALLMQPMPLVMHHPSILRMQPKRKETTVCNLGRPPLPSHALTFLFRLSFRPHRKCQGVNAEIVCERVRVCVCVFLSLAPLSQALSLSTNLIGERHAALTGQEEHLSAAQQITALSPHFQREQLVGGRGHKAPQG
jgi:hypothetical protein